MRIGDLAEAMAPGLPHRIVGIRPGEKVHEVLVTEDELRHAVEFDSYYAIYPSFPFWCEEPYPSGKELSPGFRYSSDSNVGWLDAESLRKLVGLVTAE